MIEINLSPKKKSGDLNVGGFDLSYLNVKWIVVSLVILYVPEIFLADFYDEQIDNLNKKEAKVRKDLNKIRSKVRGLKNIEKQLKALEEREKQLAKKLDAVKLIINKRQNPFEVLKYIAENIPKDVWFSKLNIKDKNLEVFGYAKNWKNIGELLESLKNSIFFANVNYILPEGMENKYAGQRVEVFKITASIVRFK